MEHSFYKLGFGTWKFGGDTKPYLDNDDEKDIEAITRALSSGIKHIDTAEMYADGKTEELVGRAIKPFKRESLFIASKVRDTKLSYDDVLKNCELSLQRLKIKALDLYYVHRPNPNIPVSETAKAMNRLVEEGLIKNVGLSNASIKTIKEYEKYLRNPIFAVQCHYNLIAREPEVKGVIDYCSKNKIKFIAWRPIQLPSIPLKIASLAEKGAYPILDEMALKYGKTNAQIAVKWVTSQDNVYTLFKTSNPKHLEEILATESFVIDKEDILKLTKNFPRQEKESFTSSGGYMPLI